MNPRILIVEDNNIRAYELQELLIEQGYKDVQTCGYAEEAIEKARNPEQSPHLYIMDIRLKGEMDGMQAAEQIEKINPKAKFIFISGQDEKISVARAAELILFVKPINNEELLARIHTELSDWLFSEKPYILKNSIFIKTRKAIERIKAENIAVLETEKGITTLFTKQGKKYVMGMGLTTFMNQWSGQVDKENLPNSLHRVSNRYAVNMVNIESYGTEAGINIEGFEGFIPYSRTMCPYFDKMIPRFKMRPTKDNTKNEDTKDD